MRARVQEASARAAKRPKLTTREQVMAPLAPFHADTVMAEATRAASPQARAKAFGGEDQLPEKSAPKHLSIQINRALHDLFAKHPEATLFFCGRENFPVSLKPAGIEYAWGKAMVVADTTAGKTKSVVISANGSLVTHAIKAAEKLAADGIGALVLNNATPNHPDVAGHQAALAKCGGKLVTVEDHQALGGAGAMLLTKLAADGKLPSAAKVLGVQGEFGQSAYTADELYNKHGIGVAGIIAAAKAIA